MRKNKEMRKTMKERIKAPMGKMILYSLLFFILVEALSLVLGQAPIIGDLASAIIVGAATIGFMASMINIYVGNEDEKPFSYFSHMAKHFKLWIFSRLWLILKYLPGMIVMTAGVVIMAAGGLGAILQYASVEELLDPDVLASVGIVALLGVLLFLIGLIIVIVVSYRYASIDYEIIYNQDPDKRARDLVKETKQRLKGHVWQWFRMAMYYVFYEVLAMLAMSLVLGLCAGLIMKDALEEVPELLEIVELGTQFIASLFALMLVYPQQICAFKEFMDDIQEENGNTVLSTEPRLEETPLE